ncbi:phosphonate transport system permease protein [Jannaschia seohaensis]|uniref:Phosphonate transport system permease protein n=1 Tax=Jannaschia seohaensis TaxID=475081 RepID=A0A2Y9C3N9_9RHOB|nr:phosphonate transport system permease protein [Jannaschia seohaensis]SSA38153.1 phosphonate transport system permease protein [Jannaschia seohaensis]
MAPIRRLLNTLRAIPEIVIALHKMGALGKLFSEVAENAPLGGVEGLRSVGAAWGQRMLFGVLPQVAPNWLSYALLRFEINIRASAILGFVGAGGIGYDLRNAMA